MLRTVVVVVVLMVLIVAGLRCLNLETPGERQPEAPPVAMGR